MGSTRTETGETATAAVPTDVKQQSGSFFSRLSESLSCLKNNDGRDVVVADDRASLLAHVHLVDYAGAATQNKAFREKMEDMCVLEPAYVLTPNETGAYFAVFDGHGGSTCSEYAAKHLHVRLNELLNQADRDRKPTELLGNIELIECLAEAYATIDRELEDLFDEATPCGSTAVTCVLRQLNGRLFYYIANVGDSRAILFNGSEPKRLTVDHVVSNESEYKRIMDKNGLIFKNRVAGVSKVTRALGQCSEKQFITGSPHMSVGEVVKDSQAFMVLVSDGISDVLDDAVLCAFIQQRRQNGSSAKDICADVLNEAKTMGSTDNMSILLPLWH
ncbi:unnamed protein product [Aphanomyces euteiches]